MLCETYRRKSELQDWIGTWGQVRQKRRYALIDALLTRPLRLHFEYAIDAFLEDVGVERAKVAHIQTRR